MMKRKDCPDKPAVPKEKMTQQAHETAPCLCRIVRQAGGGVFGFAIARSNRFFPEGESGSLRAF